MSYSVAAAQKNAEWLILAQNTLKAYKAMRQEEKAVMKEFKEQVKGIKSNISMFGEVKPDFEHENGLGKVQVKEKKPKLNSKIDISKGIQVVTEALKGVQDQKFDQDLLQQVQTSIKQGLAVADQENETEMQVKFSRNKRKHTDEIPELNEKNIVKRLRQLLKRVPESIPIEENNDESNNDDEKDQEEEEINEEEDQQQELQENENDNQVQE